MWLEWSEGKEEMIRDVGENQTIIESMHELYVASVSMGLMV